MTDTRLLAEFRNRLAERDSLMARAVARDRPAPGNGSGTQSDWCKIKNASAEEATVYIFDEIGFWGTSAQGFVDQLNAITAPKITVQINSPGGEVFDGIAIHTALATNKAHVTTFVTGIAASAASFIAMAGDTIKMARNATMMIHEAGGLVWGNKRDLQKQIDLLTKLDQNIADMYMMQAGGTVEAWLAAMEQESWYTGKEALAAGLVDEITDPDEEEDPNDPEKKKVPEPPENSRSALSLAAFHFAGRAEAPAPFIPEDGAPIYVKPPIEPTGPTERDRNMAMLAMLLKG